jgi:CDP-glycerol glycerophosphotransferase
MFEFALLRKPLFLYFEDIANYKKERNFYFDIFSLPFPIAQSMDELIRNIGAIDNEVYLQKIDAFLQKTDFFNDGKASMRAVDRIIEEINR